MLNNVGQETATVQGEKKEVSNCDPGFEANDNGGCFGKNNLASKLYLLN